MQGRRVALAAALLTLVGVARAGMPSDASCIVLDCASGMRLSWATNATHLLASMEVRGQGWVSVGFSAGGSNPMVSFGDAEDGAGAGDTKGSDIIVGWVDAEGEGHVRDYHALEHEQPTLDVRQDVALEGSSNVGGLLRIDFARRLDTGDGEEDRVVDVDGGAQPLIWAFNPERDAQPDGNGNGYGKHFALGRGAVNVDWTAQGTCGGAASASADGSIDSSGGDADDADADDGDAANASRRPYASSTAVCAPTAVRGLPM
mmetsp:Transcript_17603/g.61936  ORF Transcript_17603/g.61936 Transcript_17603/m.61936 type:complete len:260 (-) Transcript_17603:465-1244(-)